MDLSLYGDFLSDEERAELADDITDPLFGERFSLAACIAKKGGIEALPTKRAGGGEFSMTAGSYSVHSTPVFFGIPPASYAERSDHDPEAIAIVRDLPLGTTEAEIRKVCSEQFGGIRVVRILIDDPRSGQSAGAALLEFSTRIGSEKALKNGLLGGRIRRVSHKEFAEISKGDLSVLDLGPFPFQLQQTLLI